MPKKHYEFINREISWLAFNERVLQEVADISVPLLERLRFLGIFSNNRDEFFRVRVATVKRMTMLNSKIRTTLDEDPKTLLKEIHHIVLKQQKKLEKIFDSILKELEANNIFVVNEKQLNEEQEKFVSRYFTEKVRPALVPIILHKKAQTPTLKDKAIYLAIKLYNKSGSKKHKSIAYAIVEIPLVLPRFLVLLKTDKKQYVIILDDIIRLRLKEVFAILKFECIEAYNIKLTRDAELDIDIHDISRGLLEKVQKSIKNRSKAEPVRFVFDPTMPEDIYKELIKKLKLNKNDGLIPEGRYHNLKDFTDFPAIGSKKLRYPKWNPLPHPDLQGQVSLLNVIRKKDILLNFPYQSFNYIIDLLREAAIDPEVISIKINLYRVAEQSRIINALINAAKNGKSVSVIVELQARFDEENNIYWANKLQEEGVKVTFGVPGLKVHSKLLLITYKKDGKSNHIAHIGTGNFNEKTAEIYCDHSLLTADNRLTNEVNKVFLFFKNNYERKTYRHLIVSPFNVRRKFTKLIEEEIKNAKAGKPAYMIIKLNNLVDRDMIKKLYDASIAGVKIQLIIRGICSLIPGIKGMSENIEAISIIDRYLEHARVLVFCNGGDEKYFISSADWMTRNLDYRCEVTTAIYDKNIQKTLHDMLDIQLKGNVKARLLDKDLNNFYKKSAVKGDFRAQEQVYKYFSDQLK